MTWIRRIEFVGWNGPSNSAFRLQIVVLRNANWFLTPHTAWPFNTASTLGAIRTHLPLPVAWQMTTFWSERSLGRAEAWLAAATAAPAQAAARSTADASTAQLR